MTPRVLLLTHRVPYPPDRGDRIRSWHMLQYLAQRCNVYLGTTTDEPVPAATERALAGVCAQFAIARLDAAGRWRRVLRAIASGQSITDACFAAPELARTLATWQANVKFDAAVVYCSSMAQYVAAPTWANVPVLFDVVDVDSRKWEDYARHAWGWKRLAYRREARLVRRCEREIVRRGNMVAVTTRAEARLLKEVVADARPEVISNGVAAIRPELADAPPDAGRIAFVGVLDYYPNVAGIAWFVREIWPEVRRKYPEASLDIVGKQPTRAVRRLADEPGVSVHADVPDVQPYLSAAEVVIAPLPIARGVQNKVLEALAMGRPVVASPAVCAGLEATPGKQLVMAESALEWQRTMIDLLGNAELRQQLGRAGRAFVQDRHRWDDCLAPLGRWLQQVTKTASSPRLAPELLAHR